MNDDRRPDVLLVEDNPGDITLITEAFEETDVRPEIHYARDGVEALQFLRGLAPFQDAPRPAFVLLDLNLPSKDGRTVLREIKSDPVLASTPVIILSGSDAPQDISTCYALHANCYIVKPRDLNSLSRMVNGLVGFWLKTVTLPSNVGERTRGGT